MALTEKERYLLEDLKQQEQICVDKYSEHAQRASTTQLKNLFSAISQAEQGHLDMVNGMLAGRTPSEKKGKSGTKLPTPRKETARSQDKKLDAYLCADALATEKHVSSVYDTSIFECCSESMRQALSQIESQEQHHGKLLYDYMSKNGIC